MRFDRGGLATGEDAVFFDRPFSAAEDAARFREAAFFFTARTLFFGSGRTAAPLDFFVVDFFVLDFFTIR